MRDRSSWSSPRVSREAAGFQPADVCTRSTVMTRESSPPRGAPPREARTVLTTRGNSGIGLATVLELARRGFRSGGSVRSEEKARALERAAAEAGVAVETVLLDVTDASRCARVIDELRPWGIVNNAGYHRNGAVAALGHEGGH